MTLPISPELIQQLTTLHPTQLAWLSGYAWAQSQSTHAVSTVTVAQGETGAAPARRVTILSASQTGNARQVAELLLAQLKNRAIDAQLTAVADFKSRALAEEDIVLLVTSTQGEGEPPEEAVPLYRFVFGRKAPDLSRIHFGVLALGDTSYPKFCQAGKDFDAQLAKLGAQRLLTRGDCDLDYQAAASQWVDEAVAAVVALLPQVAANSSAAIMGAPAVSSQQYSKEQPFTAMVALRQKITARTANKDVQHIEIDLSGSGLVYQPGDALGIIHHNNAELVAEILHRSQVDADAPVHLANGDTVSIRTALQSHLDITQTTPDWVKAYANVVAHAELVELAQDQAALSAYIATTPPVGVLADYPGHLGAQTLHDLFRPLSPRLYSIASAQDEVGEEVHLSVGLVTYQHHQQTYHGAASGFLAAVEEGDPIRVFVSPNPHFRLPEDGHTPIIMIGAGTGIAPFRAFMQQREAQGDGGDNWLVFGNQRFTDDFLYQAEWLRYRKNGLLTRADLAWSRQGNKKVYVQHKLREQGIDVWAWLQRGAHLYVCGDAVKMARDVEAALLDIITEHGRMDAEDAAEYLNELREQKRYQRDVY